MTTPGQPINPQRLDAADVVDVLRAARRIDNVSGSEGVRIEQFRGGITIGFDSDSSHRPVADRMTEAEWFFAEIAPNGPGPNPNNDLFNEDDPDNPGAADFTDSRYWVREMLDSSGDATTDLDAGLNFRRADEFDRQVGEDHKQATGSLQPDDHEKFGMRWVPAINVSEIGVGGEGHAVPALQIVRVFWTMNPAGRGFYWFALGTGSATRFGVVRDTFNASMEHDIVVMQTVKVKEEDEGTPAGALAEYEFEKNDDGTPATGPVATWPNLRAAHYEGFRYGGETMVPRVQVLPVVRIAGVWYVQQMPRWNIQKLPISARITDCSLVSFVAGLFGRR